MWEYVQASFLNPCWDFIRHLPAKTNETLVISGVVNSLKCFTPYDYSRWWWKLVLSIVLYLDVEKGILNILEMLLTVLRSLCILSATSSNQTIRSEYPKLTIGISGRRTDPEMLHEESVISEGISTTKSIKEEDKS